MCLGSAFLLGLLGAFLAFFLTLAPVNVQEMMPPLPFPQAQEASSGYESTYAYVTFSENPINTGDEVTITLYLVNTGTLSAGIPSFGLYISSPDLLELVSGPENEGVLYGAVEPGDSYAMSWTYRALKSGLVEVSGSVSYEVHESYPGPAWWSGTSTFSELLVIE